MLVLSRKPNEAIMIGEHGKMKITVLAINGYQVKIGIEAPRDVMVHREEVYLRIRDLIEGGLCKSQSAAVEQAANDDNL